MHLFPGMYNNLSDKATQERAGSLILLQTLDWSATFFAESEEICRQGYAKHQHNYLQAMIVISGSHFVMRCVILFIKMAKLVYMKSEDYRRVLHKVDA